MPTFKLKRFSRPEVLRAVHPRFLLDLLLPHADFFAGRELTLPPPERAGELRQPGVIEGLVAVLATPGPDTPADLADALYYVHEMSTPDGMDALLAAIPLERLGCGFLELAPADVAVRAWVLERQTLERTHAELFAAHPRRFEYFQTRVAELPPFAPPSAERLRPLEQALGQVFDRRGRGRGARVFAFPHARECLFLVRHGDPYRREGTIDGEDTSSVLYRPLRFDVVVYDLATGALRVHANANWETSLYRNEFGRHLFGQIDHFPDASRYTLKPLRQRDERACLACQDVEGVRSVVVTDLRVDFKGQYGETQSFSATNVFAALRRRGQALPARGEIDRATFELRLRGVKDACWVTIEPPNVAQYSRDEFAPVIDRWLSARGFIRRPLPEPTLYATPDDVVAVN